MTSLLNQFPINPKIKALIIKEFQEKLIKSKRRRELKLQRLDKKLDIAAFTVRTLSDTYFLSPLFRGMSRKTQKSYLYSIKFFESVILFNNKTLFEQRVYNVDYNMVDYISSVLKQEYAISSIRHKYAVLSAIWEYGKRRDLVPSNPWAGPKLKGSNERDVTWTDAEVELAVTKSKELGFNLLALYILTGAETGIRLWSDIRELQWKNIIEEVDGTKILDFIVSKTNTHLMVPMSQKLIEAFNEMPKTATHIFVDRHNNRPTEGQIRHQFKGLKIATGLRQELHFRDLRRTLVTKLAENDCTEAEITAITGWKCPKSVINRYARVRLKTAKNAMNKIWNNENTRVNTEAAIS